MGRILSNGLKKRLLKGERIVIGYKFKRIRAAHIFLIAVLASCLLVTAAGAQTPAQDESTVAADKQELEATRQAIKNDTPQLDLDVKTGNTAAAQTDTNNLMTDKHAVSDARDKLKADEKDMHADDENFNGTPDSPDEDAHHSPDGNGHRH